MSHSFSLLSDKGIMRCMESGKVVISPFIRENLSTSSYDVTLGSFYYREQLPEPGFAVYNPYSEAEVDRVWGTVHEAEPQSEWMKRTNSLQLENISVDDKIIWIKSQETILAHTQEFIGGRETVTTMMKARSSLGRNFIEICKCAGWGDIGYVNRWTMEITNNSRYAMPLVVGRRVAQIVFFDSEGTLDTTYETKGKYQTSSDMDELKASWDPTAMKPKMYKDKEIQQ